MNATERAALVQGLELYDEINAVADERTLDILERRRRTAVVHRRGWLVRRLLLVADVVGLIAAAALAELVVPVGNETGAVDRGAEFVIFAATLPVWVVVAKLYGLYDRDEERTDHSTADDFSRVFHMVTVGTWLLWVGAQLTSLANPNAWKLVVFWAAAITLVPLGRAGARAIAHRSVSYLQNTIIVGAGDVGQLIAKKLLHHPEYGINLIGFIDDQPKERREDVDHLTLLGGKARLPAIVRMFDVERVIIAFSNESHDETLDVIRSLTDLDVQIDLVPRLFELVTPTMGLHSVEGVPLIGLPPQRLSRSSRLIKRGMDLAISVPALVLLGPLFGLIAIAIKLDSRGPVFFRQVRMGEKEFRIFKFRSMVADADSHKEEFAHLNKHLRNGGDGRMFKIPDDPRLTRVGRALRRSSLDELPQLINVVRGEMSLVGPRPLILEEDCHVLSWARRRLELRPGITGLWQVLGRDAIPFSEMVRLDYLYVTGWSLGGDLRLLLRTVPTVFRGGA
jgi:exopolysaccharide biosynthesis polyprenyl glycosylphosphotransferase